MSYSSFILDDIDAGCSLLQLVGNHGYDAQGDKNIHQLVEGDFHEEFKIESKTEVNEEVKEMYGVEASISCKDDVSGVTEEFHLDRSQKHVEVGIETEISSVHVQPVEQVILDVESNIIISDNQELDSEVSGPYGNIRFEPNVSPDNEEPDNLREEIHSFESNRSIHGDEIFMKDDLQNGDSHAIWLPKEITVGVKSSLECKSEEKALISQDVECDPPNADIDFHFDRDVKSSLMISGEKVVRIDDKIQEVASSELIEPSGDLQLRPVHPVEAEINFETKAILNFTSTSSDDSSNQGIAVLICVGLS